MHILVTYISKESNTNLPKSNLGLRLLQGSVWQVEIYDSSVASQQRLGPHNGVMVELMTWIAYDDTVVLWCTTDLMFYSTIKRNVIRKYRVVDIFRP